MAEPLLEYRHVGMSYGDFRALHDISERVYKRECVVICGPSGSGKSSLLRCTNGLERFQEGDIVVDGTSLRGGRGLPRLRARIAMVFQQSDARARARQIAATAQARAVDDDVALLE